ncbi:MAG: alpha-hydroxy-acid oxidizing protein [Actinomycetota bacterium]|nr:alpha-hydroxy-acid oxidizing protein [Actinomycetota bacterium]
MPEPLNLADYERLAERTLEPGAYWYFAGGSGDELTLRDNIAAYRSWSLRPRVLVDVGEVSAGTTVLGRSVSLPVLVAPTALMRLAHPDGEPAAARAAATAGTIFCLSTLATASPAEVAGAAPGPERWFQLYCFRDREITRYLVAQAEDAGFGAIVLTVDVPFLGRRERDLRSGFAVPADIEVPSFAAATGRREAATVADMIALVDPALTWRDLEELASMTSLPVVAKGILTAEDARLACDHGAAAVVVSNHGGRQLDTVPASLDALGEVVEAVDEAVPVLVDGGVRRGIDVVKALALGATAVMVGRPVVWGLAVRGEAGVLHVLELLREEVGLALALLGCSSPEEVGPQHVVPAAR